MGLAGGHFCATASSLLGVSALLERECALMCPGQLGAVLCEALQTRAGPVCVYSLPVPSRVPQTLRLLTRNLAVVGVCEGEKPVEIPASAQLELGRAECWGGVVPPHGQFLARVLVASGFRTLDN